MRRYAPLRQSSGIRIPSDVRQAVMARDMGCVGHRHLGMPGDCIPGLELDHVRASGALGRKSRSTVDNLVALCPVGHRVKTEHGREWRPKLLAYLARVAS